MPLDPRHEAAMATMSGLDPREFRNAYLRDRAALDRGTMEADEYWRRLLARGGVEATPELLQRIEREDSLGWSQVNTTVVSWSYELREAGFRTGVLSNMPFEKLRFMRSDSRFRWISDFSVAFWSCEHKLIKPEASIYRAFLKEMGSAPEECLFLDDVQENVDGAHAVGIPAILFRSATEAATELQSAWGLPVTRLRNGNLK